MNEAKLLNNLPLNGDLKPLSIGDENSPLELSTTKVRIQNLDVIGDFNIDGQDDNLLDRTGTNTYVKNTGDNFGIGTTSPDEELHVYGTIKISTHADSLEFASPTSSKMAMGLYGNNDLLTKNANGDTLMTILNAGNVGIGTTSPSTLLHLQYAGNTELRVEATGSNDAELRMKVGGASNNSRLTFEDNSGAREGGITYKHSDDYLSFSGKGTDGEMARFDSSGNFGIGTTSPITPLDITGNVHINGDLDLDSNHKITGQYHTNSSELTYLRMYNGGDASINMGTKHSLGYISFESGNGSYTERMRITNTGNVGIGTTSPTNELHIDGDVRIEDGHKLFFGDTATGEYIYRNTNDLKLYSGDDILINAGDDIVHRGDKHGFEDTAASRVMTIDAGNGKVGIGTTSPTYTLTVEGQSEFENSATDDVILAKLTTDSVHKFSINTSGQMQWGDGTNPRDTNLYRDSANKLRTADTFIVDGNVGIGTASPTSAAGVARFLEIADANHAGLILNDTGGTDFTIYSGADKLWYYADTSAKMVMTNNGNVGIGTTSPDTLLDIENSDAGGHASVRIARGNTAGSANVIFASADDGYNDWLIGTPDSDDWGDGTDFFIGRVSGSSANAKLVIDNDGKVGMGTTSPSQPLHIVSSGNGGLEIDNSSGAPTIIFDIPSNEQARLYFQEDDTVLGSIIYETSGTPDAIAFKAGSNTERMRITDTGNVGIGITAPDEKLHIVGSVWIDDNGTNDGLKINPGSGSGKTSIQALENGSSTQPLELQATSFDFWGQSVRLMYLDTNSNISLSNNDDGTSNTVFGYQAGHLIGSGDNYNTFIGHQVADADMTNATKNIGIGYQALSALTEGDANTIIGYQAGDAITTGGSNVVVGKSALSTATTTAANVVIGSGAMEDVASGQAISSVVSIGFEAFKGSGSTTTGTNGTIAIGQEAAKALTTGVSNTVIGYQAGLAMTNNGSNVVIGYQAFKAADAGQGQNVVIGRNAGDLINTATQSDNNVIIGMEAGRGGSGAMKQCVAIGRDAMKSTGSNAQTGTIAIGMEALIALTTGAKNTSVGYQAGYALATGGENTIVGYDSDTDDNSATNQTVIGSEVTGVADNSVTLGNANVTAVYMAQDSGATVYCGDINVQYHYIRAGINYDQTAGTFVVIPLDGTTRPFTSFTDGGEKLTMIAPHSGTLETIYIRSEEVAGNPVVVGFHKATDGTEVPSTVPTASVSVDMSAVADDTSTKFAFTSNNTFSAGDVLGFSIDPANDINDCSFMIVLKFDTTT
jgi:hypothetical protein